MLSSRAVPCPLVCVMPCPQGFIARAYGSHSSFSCRICSRNSRVALVLCFLEVVGSEQVVEGTGMAFPATVPTSSPGLASVSSTVNSGH